ncbi:MAG: RecX family transcriptional regulator [Phycisphaerales bacterium]|nr:RecX family transcriptional regulator [Phycisphaerales bacterium]
MIRAIVDLPDEPAMVQVRAGRRRFRLRRVDAAPMALYEGMTLTDAVLETIEQAVATAKALTAAQRMLARRPMAIATMRSRLGTRFGADAADTVIDALTRQGLLNDDHAAASVRRGLERSGPVGPARLAQALHRHGIHPDAAQAAVNDLDQLQEPVAAAREAAEPMLRGLARHDRATQARRLAGRLARRGFDHDTVRQVLDQLGLQDGYDAAP